MVLEKTLERQKFFLKGIYEQRFQSLGDTRNSLQPFILYQKTNMQGGEHTCSGSVSVGTGTGTRGSSQCTAVYPPVCFTYSTGWVNSLLPVTSPTANLTVFSWVPLLSRRSPANVGESLKSSRKRPQVLKVFRPVRAQGCRLTVFSVVNQRNILNRKTSSHISKKEGKWIG